MARVAINRKIKFCSSVDVFGFSYNELLQEVKKRFPDKDLINEKRKDLIDMLEIKDFKDEIVSPAEKILYSTDDNNIMLFSIDTNSEEQLLKGNTSKLSGIIHYREDQYIILYHNHIVIYDILSRKVISSENYNGKISIKLVKYKDKILIVSPKEIKFDSIRDHIIMVHEPTDIKFSYVIIQKDMLIINDSVSIFIYDISSKELMCMYNVPEEEISSIFISDNILYLEDSDRKTIELDIKNKTESEQLPFTVLNNSKNKKDRITWIQQDQKQIYIGESMNIVSTNIDFSEMNYATHTLENNRIAILTEEKIEIHDVGDNRKDQVHNLLNSFNISRYIKVADPKIRNSVKIPMISNDIRNIILKFIF